MALAKKPMVDGGKDEQILWLVVRSLFLIIAILFAVYGLFIKQPCDVDAVFLSCRLTGSVADIIGSIMFFGGMVFMSGIVKGLRNMWNAANTSTWNIVAFVVTALGAILFWNL